MHAELLGCGQTAEGQLGVRISEPSVAVPDRIIGAPNDSDGTSVKAVACGENHTIFLTKDGKMWSVGDNKDGQLGRGCRGEGSFSIYPVSLTSGVEIVQIGAGRAHSVAVGEDGRVFAWGSNEHGQLGMPSSIVRQESPKRVSELIGVVQVAVGADHCMALTEAGRVFVWGEQADGRCLHVPLVVDELNGIPIVRIVAGSRHCVAISASGAVYTWGQNDCGQLGNDDFKPQTRIHHLSQMDGLGVIEAACGDRHTLLLTNCGRVFSCGSDSLGQCGFGKKIEKRTSPTAVSDLIGSHVTRIAAGNCHSLAIVGGYVYPFGLNSSGQLGNGKLVRQTTPRRTDELDHVTSVFAGYDQTFFIRSNASIEISETTGPNISLKRPQALSKAILEPILKSGDKIAVITLLESVFSSLACINNSFLLPDERKYLVGTDNSHGLDMDDVMEAFMLIDESSHKKSYLDLIMESVELVFESTNSRQFRGVECLRIYLILPWLSVFTENVTIDFVKRMHGSFAKSMCFMHEEYGRVMEKWWGDLPTRHFRRMVTVMRTAIKVMVAERKTPRECEFFLHALTRLNMINKKKHIVPLEMFYIEELTQAFDIKMDYYKWVTKSEVNVVSSEHWSSFPFLLNGAAKGELLFMEAFLTQTIRQQNCQIQALLGNYEMPVLELHVRREFIVQDTMNQMASIDIKDLQKPLKVKIHGEEADDAGGVKKEFFLIVMQKILQAEYGMFNEDEQSHLVWFSGLPAEYCDREQFRQLGRLVGLAVFNHVIVPFPFPLALYKYLLDQSPTLEDLCELLPVEGKGLQDLLDYEGDDVEDVFCLNFCITFNILGENRTIEMEYGGEQTAVTNENRKRYVELYVKHRLELGPDGEMAEQAKHFRDGFRDSVHSRILSFFQPRELMELIVGNENYEWSQFRECVEYKGEYSKEHPAIDAFWKAFYQLDDEQKKKFLQFLCGSTRLPVAGMSALNIIIQPSSPESLPVAHTCFNLLDLPNIANPDELLRRLLISIEHTQGFTLV